MKSIKLIFLTLFFVCSAYSNESHNCASEYCEGKLYLDPTKIELSDEGFSVRTEQAFQYAHELFHDENGYFIPTVLPKIETIQVDHDQLKITQEGIFVLVNGAYKQIEGLFSSKEGEFFIMSSHDCPPLTSLCPNCCIACNPFWAKKCYQCGRSL